MMSQEELVLLLDQIPDPVFLKNREHRWIYVNHAFASFYGRERDWFLGKSERELVGEQAAAEAWRIDEDVLSSGQTKVNLEQHTNGAGVRSIVEVKKSPLSALNQDCLIGVIRDLTVFTEI